MKVLLVEDDPEQKLEIEADVKQILGPATEICGPYDNFQAVLPHIEKKDIDLALIDIQLYDDHYAGIHVAELVQRFLSIPIIFISGVTDIDVIEKAEKVILSDFLQKPFDKPGLKRAVDRALHKIGTNFSGNFRVVFKSRGRDRYWVKTDRSAYVALNPKEIICVEAMDQYCRFYIFENKPITAKTNLKSGVLDTGLSAYDHFFLLNRSFLVNKDYISKVDGNQLTLRGLDASDKSLLKRNPKYLTIPRDKRKETLRLLGIQC